MVSLSGSSFSQAWQERREIGASDSIIVGRGATPSVVWEEERQEQAAKLLSDGSCDSLEL